MKRIMMLIGAFLAASISFTISEEAGEQQIGFIWSTVIPSNYEGKPQTVMDFARTPTGGLALYGQHQSAPNTVQIINGETVEFIPVKPTGSVHLIGAKPDGSFFIAGSIRKNHGWFEKFPSDAYVAYVSPVGDLIWERSFGGAGFQVARDIVALPNGGALVAVHDAGSVLLWAIDNNGKTLWHESVGVKSAAINVISSAATIVAATMDDAGRNREAPDYVEDLALSFRDLSGREFSRNIVRPDFNRFASSDLFKVSVDVGDQTILVVSAWKIFNRKHEEYRPTELAVYDHAGALKWRHRPVVDSCDAPPFLLPGGEVIIACVEPFDDGPRHLVLSRYSPTGEVTELRARLPECQQSVYPVAIHVVAMKQNVLTLLASRPAANIGAGCSWIGTIDIG